ncbi:ABC transporter permease subunit [Roseomonas sp. E05]|uniref:ABC transporter permease n=1 Tax=Roseomonas sp. E05 TaxID=3046310 RepID=UPI0024B92BF6|nr:ABC transporter permease subunit [Roseomonas sp. E05]MDJ0390298.1 ABC transporter permease subunit [Roseomonas sp. E05]
MSPALAIARREGGELLCSPRGLAWLLAAAGVLSGFALLLVGSTELGLLDNAQVVYDMAGLTIALGALLALVSGVDAVAGERERGALLPLLATASPRRSIVLGRLGGQALAWSAMLAISAPYLWAVGSTGQNLGAALLGLLLFGTPVALAAGAAAMALGARLRSARAALLASLIALLLVASPLLLGPSLRQSAIGQGFDAVNPFSGATNALDAMVIDGQGLAAQGWHLALVLAWWGLAYAAALRALRPPRRPGEEIVA